MSDDHTGHAEDSSGATRKEPEHNRYAITLTALVASAQVAWADQVQEQPPEPVHDYSSGFDTTGNDGDGQGDARGY
jgi:hypothetical protein